MWPKRPKLMTSLSSMTSSKTKLKWIENYEKVLKEKNKIMARETLLAFSDFTKPFNIFTDASKIQ